MSDIRGPGDEKAARKDRHREHDVIQVGHPAVIGIIAGEDVPRRDIRSPYDFDEALDRLVENADEAWNTGAGTDQIAGLVGDASPDVENS